MLLLSQRRPMSFITKMGRFFIALCLLNSHFLMSQNEGDEDIIVFEDEETPETGDGASPPSAPSGSLEDDFFVKANTALRMGVRPHSQNILAFPALGMANLALGLQAYP